MSNKTKTIKVSSGWFNTKAGGTKLYRVEQITDSVDYSPTDMLTKEEVDQLCHARDWKVTIIATPNK